MSEKKEEKATETTTKKEQPLKDDKGRPLTE